MNCKIQKSKLSGKIICPPNKSYTHRAIFLAALSDGKSIVKKFYAQTIQLLQSMHVKNLESRLKI